MLDSYFMVFGLYNGTEIFSNYSQVVDVGYIVYDETNDLLKPMPYKFNNKICMVSKLRNWEEVKRLFDV